MAVTELGNELGIHKSTVFRLLATMESRGLVDQNANRGRYQLGYGIVRLAAGATGKLDLSHASRRVCEELAEEVGESVNIDILDDRTVLSIDQITGTSAMTTLHWVGRRTPLHATSSGKVFLSYLSEEQRAEVLGPTLERFTNNTITDSGRLQQQLEVIRTSGFGFTLEEYEVGLAAIAAPIRDLDGQVVASISVSGPTFRLNNETIPVIAGHVMRAAGEISERLGKPRTG